MIKLKTEMKKNLERSNITFDLNDKKAYKPGAA
jgi:hypothetical protein